MMKITVKAHSLLDEYLPAGAAYEETTIEVEPGASPLALLTQLGIPRHRVNLVFVNDVLLREPEWSAAKLDDGDVVALWPLLAGG